MKATDAISPILDALEVPADQRPAHLQEAAALAVREIAALRRDLSSYVAAAADLATEIDTPKKPEPNLPDGFEWIRVEVFGHRSHYGRGMEVEKFGAKQLRIDVPQLGWTEPTAEKPEPEIVINSWVSLFYGGSAIFSHALTDEATVMKANRPRYAPGRLLAAPVTSGASQEGPGDEDGEIPW
jgi:hypothetical protein